MRGSATIPAGIVPGFPDHEIEVEFDYNPGSAPTIGGPPESCDPGDPPEIDSVDCYQNGAKFDPSDEQDSAVTEWLYAHYEFGADDDDGEYPEYDR